MKPFYVVDFGRFMTPQSAETLIFAFISITGQSVPHNRHKIFSFGFFYQRERIYLGIL